MKRPLLLLLALSSLPARTQSAAPDARLAAPPREMEATAVRLREKALIDETAYALLEQLTTRFGPRLAGSDRERDPARWMAARLRGMGFENVRIAEFPLTLWSRESESGAVLGPSAQPLKVTLLGGSPSTGAAGVQGEVARFASLEELRAAPPGSLGGKIAFLDYRMPRMESGFGYGVATAGRSEGPTLAAARGALAFLMRSASTAEDREPHTGLTRYAGSWAPLPAFALSPADADQLARLVALGPTRIELQGQAAQRRASSQNVIAEVGGSAAAGEVVLIGAHLDSWDLGTGAQDDGAGVAIVTAAAKLIRDHPRRPRRTIRLVLFGAEEVSQPVAPGGLFGGHAYARSVGSDAAAHVVASESDLGSGRIVGIDLPSGDAASPFAQAAARLLLPLGILVEGEVPPHGGADMMPLQAAGVPVFLLKQDASRYFDVHHAATDTLDTVDKADLAQNVAAWASFVWLIADGTMSFRTQ